MNPDHPKIRPATETDFNSIAKVWYRSGKVAYPYLKDWIELTPEKATEVISQYILPGKETWVALLNEEIIGFLVLDESLIDRLYIDPHFQSRGIGLRLLNHAKQLHPNGLELFTHQANQLARRFYETHGFTAIAFGTSPPPESAPDVKYSWEPKIH